MKKQELKNDELTGNQNGNSIWTNGKAEKETVIDPNLNLEVEQLRKMVEDLKKQLQETRPSYQQLLKYDEERRKLESEIVKFETAQNVMREGLQLLSESGKVDNKYYKLALTEHGAGMKEPREIFGNFNDVINIEVLNTVVSLIDLHISKRQTRLNELNKFFE